VRTALVTGFRQPLQMNDFATFDMLPFIPLHFLCTHFWHLVHYNSHRSQIHTHMHAHTHTRLMDLCLGLSECASAPIWILLKQKTVSGKSDNKYNIMEWSVVFIVVRLRKRKRSLRVALSQSAIWNSNVILQLIKSNMLVSICTEWTLLSVHNHWHLAGLLTIVIQFIEDIQMLCHWHTM